VWISALQLDGFRNYQQLHLTLEPGINLFVGENGSGKTNLVEACAFLSDFESHRVAGYSPLINANSYTAQISTRGTNKTRELSVAAELNRDKPNRYFLNGNQRKRQAEVVGAIQVVVFAPEDLDIIRRDPSDRRKFLDLAMTQLKPRYAGVRADYERVLKQKTALLKSAKTVSNPDLTTLDIWDDQLVSLGTEIMVGRLELIQAIRPLLQGFYSKLSGQSEEIALSLAASVVNIDEDGVNAFDTVDSAEISAMFHEKLQSVRDKELERGLCLVGPHRDELLIQKSGLNARAYSSQGEAWSLALGLKLAMAELIRQESQSGDPVLILDDVFAVLDSGRRSRLVEFVSNNEQVLITSADPDAIPDLQVARKYLVRSGEIVA
jgi:DNA replication and repair protein RecF